MIRGFNERIRSFAFLFCFSGRHVDHVSATEKLGDGADQLEGDALDQKPGLHARVLERQVVQIGIELSRKCTRLSVYLCQLVFNIR